MEIDDILFKDEVLCLEASRDETNWQCYESYKICMIIAVSNVRLQNGVCS